MADLIDLTLKGVRDSLGRVSKETMGFPGRELETVMREATQQVEADLALEDEGWWNFSSTSADVITDRERITNVGLSRLYYTKDPLGKQAIRLWTDYTFGVGMTWQTEHDNTKTLLGNTWESKANKEALSARGQRKSSDKLLVDGEIFFAIFLGAKDEPAKIRLINPLEITEIISDPDDIDDVRYYHRSWADRQGKTHDDIYRDTTNIKDEPAMNSAGKTVKRTEDALIYHLGYNTTGQRGNPLLLPALDWMKWYRRFLASRVAIMLALARFAWHTKVSGGQTAVDAIKAYTHEQEVKAGSHLLENLGSDTQPIKTDSGARNAYDDGRMLKLQVCAAVGIPEQYFGDISIGNLATAKTVELPMLKMFQSYQKVWEDTYRDINEVILENSNIPPDNWYVDMDFPPIAPEDVLAAAEAIVGIVGVMPEFAKSPDVQQIAMMVMGVNDPAQALEQMKKLGEKEIESSPDLDLAKALKRFREVVLKDRDNGNKKEVVK